MDIDSLYPPVLGDVLQDDGDIITELKDVEEDDTCVELDRKFLKYECTIQGCLFSTHSETRAKFI